MPKIVAFSDTHGRHERLQVPAGDILIFAGDCGAHSENDLEAFDRFLGTLPHNHKIIVAGNCDPFFENHVQRARQTLDNAVYLQDEALELAGLRVYGTPWQPTFLNMSFNLPRGEALAKKWAEIPDDTDILVTHGPPYGILDKTSRDQRVGCRKLLERVEQIAPRLHIFGHIHESRGQKQTDETIYVNAGCSSSGQQPFSIELD